MDPIQNTRILGFAPLTPPQDLIAKWPVSERAGNAVLHARDDVRNILDGQDRRLIVVVGPCSIHNEEAAIQYAGRLRVLADELSDHLLVIMRVYFEKPRTTVGWKGLINDPHLDDTFDVVEGLTIARRLLLAIAEMDLPTATEMLEPITPQYIADLISLASIGARTTESPTHRQMASGLSMPVGFKNGTDGSLEVALNAMLSARAPHRFLGIDPQGRTCVVNTAGNPWGHLVLRGGHSGPNYAAECLQAASEKLIAAELSPHLLVDCSHANSNKDYRLQAKAWNDVIGQRLAGNDAIIGLMLESNLQPGKQSLTDDPSQLEFGVSITDGCIGWKETEALLREAHSKMRMAN